MGILEQRKKKEQERIEAEKKAKQAQEKAEALLGEYEDLVKTVEAAFEGLKEAAGPFQKEGELPKTLAEVESAFTSLKEAGEDVQTKEKECKDFSTKNWN